jgi:starch synthase
VKIAFLTTEAVPFAKTGGLADVGGALPAELARRGHEVIVIMPGFRSTRQAGQTVETVDAHVLVRLADRQVTAGITKSRLPDSSVTVYFIDQPQYYERAQLYGDAQGDYRDNCERFVFFSRAALQWISQLGFEPDVVHCNDWPTGLVPVYLDQRVEGGSWSARAASLMTIHNIGYQGQFWHWDMLLTGLGWDLFNWQQLEFHGHLNLLKAGIVFADAINTVSPRYAEEIQTSEFGFGLDGVLRNRRDVLSGIINGIDAQVWNPATDPHLPMRYGLKDWPSGKAACKASLQGALGLAVEPRVPLVGLVGRLAEQKGWDLVIDLIGQWLHDRRAVQWVVLGTGDQRYHDRLSALAVDHGDRLALRLQFSESLAHQIEAGSDLFLMPSRYEPCGLNQLYSLRYGAVPVVHPTGGLADTVVPANDQTLADQSATGFWMPSYDLEGLASAMEHALQCYKEPSPVWGQMVTAGMKHDWSWSKSAAQYERLYQQIVKRKRQATR